MSGNVKHCQDTTELSAAEPQRGTPVGSSLRTQTDGPPALPTENTLLAAGAESTAPSKPPNQPGQPTQTPSISPQHLQPQLQPSPAVRILSDWSGHCPVCGGADVTVVMETCQGCPCPYMGCDVTVATVTGQGCPCPYMGCDVTVATVTHQGCPWPYMGVLMSLWPLCPTGTSL